MYLVFSIFNYRKESDSKFKLFTDLKAAKSYAYNQAKKSGPVTRRVHQSAGPWAGEVSKKDIISLYTNGDGYKEYVHTVIQLSPDDTIVDTDVPCEDKDIDSDASDELVNDEKQKPTESHTDIRLKVFVSQVIFPVKINVVSETKSRLNAIVFKDKDIKTKCIYICDEFITSCEKYGEINLQFNIQDSSITVLFTDERDYDDFICCEGRFLPKRV